MTAVEHALSGYVHHLDTLVRARWNWPETMYPKPCVTVEPGSKYYRIVVTFPPGDQRSVHSFVCRTTGDVYKPATWKSRAAGVRFNLIRDRELLLQVMDASGSYLYKR
jgi:hypothetical protein